MKKLRTVLIVLIALALFLFSTSGHFLIVNRPQHADAIVVLAGESDRRPALGLQLLQQGYAPRMVLDVPANAKIYDETMLQISQQYVRELPQAQSVIICPIYGLSTKAESQDVSQCLRTLGIHSILVVTSDYHTRRALSTFRHELPGMQISVAAATDPQQFGGAWWQHRQWAKLNFDEWLRLVWWHVVDRWR
ncbi:MAG: hypothetical protein DMG94_02300 [Acidobacteria bacterium]|nr:MAG: hypothetical protein DMG94_02300 [Acidobacteriota bacterium]